MTESRQQRRARDRADQKSASGPGPNLHSVPTNRQVIVRARVVWLDDPDYAPEPVWHATWEDVNQEPVLLPNNEDASYPTKVANYMEGSDLELLVAEVLAAIAHQWPDADVAVSWSMDEDTAEQADTSGITFPNRHPKPA